MRFNIHSSSKVQFHVVATSLLALAGCGGGGSSYTEVRRGSFGRRFDGVVTTNGSGSPASVAPGAQVDPSWFAATCAYFTDVARTHVYDPSMEPLRRST